MLASSLIGVDLQIPSETVVPTSMALSSRFYLSIPGLVRSSFGVSEYPEFNVESGKYPPCGVSRHFLVRFLRDDGRRGIQCRTIQNRPNWKYLKGGECNPGDYNGYRTKGRRRFHTYHKAWTERTTFDWLSTNTCYDDQRRI